MEFIILNPDDLTEEQLIEAINSNSETATLTRQEIEKLKAIEKEDAKKTSTSQKKPIKEEKTPVDKPQAPIDQEFEDEVNYYLSALNKITLENIDEIYSILPARKHYRYNDILYRLKLAVIKNLKEIKDCIGEEGLDIAVCQEFKEDIELEKRKLEYLTKALAKKEEAEETEAKDEIDNKLVFTLTSGGNIRVFEEIDGIPPEYYEQFYTLLQSIKDGTFKNIKKFNNNKDITGLSEVRLNQARIIFDHLDKNVYAVITAFVKKTQNDRYYQTAIRQKACDYYSQKEMIIKNLSNPEFLEQHALYEQELFNKISSGQLDGSQTAKKKGSE